VSAVARKLVTLGRISGVFGVKGWVKVVSYTEPRTNVVEYDVWILRSLGRDLSVDVEEGQGHGGQIVAKLRGIDDRDRARELVGAEILVDRNRLPPCAPGEFYWVDLEGLEVRTPGGEVLGKVDHLLATGSNDVLVLEGHPQRLIPFLVGSVIRHVDLDAGYLVADWVVED
jgi:16S rRNA processing protein RimM